MDLFFLLYLLKYLALLLLEGDPGNEWILLIDPSIQDELYTVGVAIATALGYQP